MGPMVCSVEAMGPVRSLMKNESELTISITLDMISEEMLHQKPIDLRHICLFYLGHMWVSKFDQRSLQSDLPRHSPHQANQGNSYRAGKVQGHFRARYRP